MKNAYRASAHALILTTLAHKRCRTWGVCLSSLGNCRGGWLKTLLQLGQWMLGINVSFAST